MLKPPIPKLLPPEARQLEQLLRERLLPLAGNGAPTILFDAPPRGLPPLSVEETPMPPLPAVAGERAYPHVQRWREQQLNSLSTPMLGCVFEGEADYRVHRPPGPIGGQWNLTLKSGTLFLIAPGTPFSDGSKVAWERPNPTRAYSRVILMQLRAEGVICHTFTSDKGKLWLHPYLFLYNFEALQLGEKLLQEMRRAHPSLSVVYLYWQLIFRLLERTISEGDVSVLSTPAIFGRDNEGLPGALGLEYQSAVQLAEYYIKSHLDDPELKVKIIAKHTGMSERHLNRLFQNAHGIPLSTYIQQKRLEKACVLLQHSRLPIHQIANYCGFISLSHFTTWFVRQIHQSPRQFRQEKSSLAEI